MRKTSTRDIANVAGVSQATVSYILSGRTDQSISDTTRERVLHAAHALRYRPNRLAAGFFGGKSGMIGIVFPNVEVSFFSRMFRGIQQACKAHDSVSILTFTQTDALSEQREVNRMLEHRVDGLIIVPSQYTLPWFEDVRVEELPCVILDDRTYAAKCDVVASDDVPGAMQAVRYLISLGHERIAMIGGPEEMTSYRDRRQGYIQALSEAGVDFDPDLYIAAGSVEESDQFNAKVWNLIEKGRPTAVFAATDYFANDFIAALGSRGLSVPGDISVVGYSDSEISVGRDLTTVHQDSFAMGVETAERLFRRIAEPELERKEILLPTQMVIRKSCAPAGRRP